MNKISTGLIGKKTNRKITAPIDGNCIMYLVDIELGGQSAPLIERGVKGAFVTCAVQTKNIIEAIEKSTSALV